ncbi:hypothetical protein F4808DRAFT_468555 [Astrocystis sublimbata]|nr:hypothetical protein F4808DRAFT_468555 [Astrocystis sublimbata]
MGVALLRPECYSLRISNPAPLSNLFGVPARCRKLNALGRVAVDLLIVSLLQQLANKFKGFSDDDILEWFRSRHNSGRRPNKIETLIQYLCTFISNIDKAVFIVLDGLDQVPVPKGGDKGRLKLLELITCLTKVGYPNLHILLLSRDEQDIRSCLEKLGDILVSKNVEAGLGRDLNNFIVKKLEDMQLPKGNKSVKAEIKARLDQDGQDRKFPRARRCLRDRTEEGEKEDEKQLNSILLWLLNKKRPLSQNELATAVGLPNPSLVTEICSRELVESSKQQTIVAGKDQVLDVFRFAHFSMQEYLKSVTSGKKNKKAIESHLGTGDAYLDASITYSSSKVEEDDVDGGKGSEHSEGPLLECAAEYWFHHYNMIDRDCVLKNELKKSDDEIWSQLLFDQKKLKF